MDNVGCETSDCTPAPRFAEKSPLPKFDVAMQQYNRHLSGSACPAALDPALAPSIHKGFSDA
jgi:hypothetical protein